MDTERVMSGLAALRDTIALPELFGMVIESLGGQEALAAALGGEVENEADRCRDRAEHDLAAMRDGDVARLETIQGMAESFCTWLHAKGEAQMKRDNDEAVDKIRQLSGSFNKAARAVRLSMVLKHEVAGLPPLPQARANQNGAANQNNAGNPGGNPPVNHDAAGRALPGERREADDLSEDERDDAEDEFGLEVLALLDAFDKDVATASPEIQAEVKRQSPAVILTTIAASIPHPIGRRCGGTSATTTITARPVRQGQPGADDDSHPSFPRRRIQIPRQHEFNAKAPRTPRKRQEKVYSLRVSGAAGNRLSLGAFLGAFASWRFNSWIPAFAGMTG